MFSFYRAKSGAVAPNEEDSPAVGRESATEYNNIPQSPHKPGRNGKRYVVQFLASLITACLKLDPLVLSVMSVSDKVLQGSHGLKNYFLFNLTGLKCLM